MSYPRIREAIESSSAAVLSAVVAALSDAWYQPASVDGREARMAQPAARLPDLVVRWLVGRYVRESGLDPQLARYVTSEGLARQAAAAYGAVPDGTGYPAILVGAPNGGIAYLAALLQVPFLPSHFVLSFTKPNPVDDVAGYQANGAALIEPILRRNPDLQAINHYDPLHDRFLVEQVNHVRLKLLDLPEAYRSFIRDHLAPEGVILYADCSYPWLQYQVGPKHFFQVGGLGGFRDDEFLDGASAIERWLASQGSKHRGGWRLDDVFPLIEQPESEWGTLPAFRSAVGRFASEHSFDFQALHGAHPEDFGALAYTAYLWESRLHERTPGGLLLECFSQVNPTAALRSDLLPIWLPFNTEDSLSYLKNMLDFVPDGLPVLLTMLTTFTTTPDMPPANAWQEAAGKVGRVHWIGPAPQRYPADLAARFEYLPQVQAWTRERPGQPPQPHLTPDELLEMMRYLNKNGSSLLERLVEA